MAIPESPEKGTLTRIKNHRIVVIKRGGPDALQLVEEELPRPAPGEVRVKLLAAGVSAFDLMLRSKWFPGFPSLPYTPGVDLVGVVDEVGEGVSGLEPGQMVGAGPDFELRGYSEFNCVSADELVPVPAELDPAEAVCLVANYLTAYHMLHAVAQVQPGERILVQGAAGGVGSALLELGRLADLEMYGTASEYNHEIVAGLGATPIDYRNEDFVERVRVLTGDGVDAVFDPIGGGRQLWRSYRALRKGGRLVWFGVAASARSGIKVIPLSLVTRLGLSLLPDGKHAPLAKEPEPKWLREKLPELFDLATAGKLSPLVAARIPLAEAARAHELLERGHYAGKVVLIPE